MINDFLNIGTDILQSFDFAALLSTEIPTFQGVVFYDNDFEKLLVRFLINFSFTFVIARVLYYKTTQRKDYLFAFLLTSIVTFFICFALKKFEIKTGMALGLFAIFGIIRFRTTTMPVKEMTYLFVIIGIAVINALTSSKFSYSEMAFVNGTILFAIFAIERLWVLPHEARKEITYEKIDLIKPEMHKELVQDLEERTGLKITRIEIGKINFLNDTAKITVFFHQDEQSSTYYKDDTTDPTY